MVLRLGAHHRPRLAAVLPRATLTAQSALNKIQARVLSDCRPAPTAARLSTLNSAVLSYLLSGSYAVDFEPPVVFVTRVSQFRLLSGSYRLSFSWFAGDTRSRIASSSVWYTFNGAPWRPLSGIFCGPMSCSVDVLPGTTFRFAVQAADTAGNRSACAYTS